jgi:hypothetical protein
MRKAFLVTWLLTSLNAGAVFAFDRPWQVCLPDDPLARSVAGIVAEDDGTRAVRKHLQQRLLALTDEHGSPEDRGLIYASIADMYRRPEGTAAPDESMREEAVEYSQLALRQPLDDVNVCAMYSNWAQAIAVGSSELPPESLAAVRRRAALLYLLGLRCALDYGAPAESQPVPSVGTYHVVAPAGAPELEEARQRHARELQARREADRLNALSCYRGFFISQCARLYGHPSADPAELRVFAEAVLVRYPDALSEVLTAADK